MITLNYDKKLEEAFKEKQQYLGYNLIKNLEVMPLVKKNYSLYFEENNLCKQNLFVLKTKSTDKLKDIISRNIYEFQLDSKNNIILQPKNVNLNKSNENPKENSNGFEENLEGKKLIFS